MTEETKIQETQEPVEEKVSTKSTNNYLIPLAIVVGFGLVAGAIFTVGNVPSSPTTATSGTGDRQVQPTAQPSGSTDNVREVTKEDHIKGDINSPVVIVEYSDFECPFCKRFHDTVNQIMDERGDSGEVAWVYRHFPLDQLHPRNARKVAVISECVNELAGADAFWQFTDGYFEVSPANDRTDLTTVLPQLYAQIGVDQDKVEACVASGKYDKHVQDDIDNAIETGGRGTPWSVVIAPNGKTFPVNGAQPLAAIEQLINLALQEK